MRCGAAVVRRVRGAAVSYFQKQIQDAIAAGFRAGMMTGALIAFGIIAIIWAVKL